MIDGKDIKKTKPEQIESAETYNEVELVLSDPKKITRIRSQMSLEDETMTIDFLRKNSYMFAWSPSDFQGIDPEVIVHRLNVDPQARPIKQKKRAFGVERNQVIEEEVSKLLKAGYVSEIQYTSWLSNMVIIPKASGKWRMCTDFTNLNKACPKDPYHLPRIDLLVDSIGGCALFMMDAYQSYHQIFMAEEDMDKTSFITEKGVYCYNVMPFGLKNAGAPYQRLVNRMFKKLIGSTMEVYDDDMLVKSRKERDHLQDLGKAFSIMRTFGMKLNLTKCTFGVRGGKFLGYLVSERRIEANSEKIEAIMQIPSPKTIKDVQKLTGKIASLNRFIARSADRNLPFFKILRQVKNFEWSEECEKALKELKVYLATPPLLANPMVGETLYVYLAVSIKCSKLGLGER
ncbi:UNVERIFIED_CONTAM: Polyprotein P3 [Sesamum radiatum]|uniref:Polyprotein P3 n=1 Tax=Sesamum radiatum TaxID=300843 RepID=A0AAW2W1N2_SESRA